MRFAMKILLPAALFATAMGTVVAYSFYHRQRSRLAAALIRVARQRAVAPAHAVQVHKAVLHGSLLSLSVEARWAQSLPPVEHHDPPCLLGLDAEINGVVAPHLSQMEV